jgi:hypothetical protein
MLPAILKSLLKGTSNAPSSQKRPPNGAVTSNGFVIVPPFGLSLLSQNFERFRSIVHPPYTFVPFGSRAVKLASKPL